MAPTFNILHLRPRPKALPKGARSWWRIWVLKYYCSINRKTPTPTDKCPHYAHTGLGNILISAIWLPRVSPQELSKQGELDPTRRTSSSLLKEKIGTARGIPHGLYPEIRVQCLLNWESNYRQGGKNGHSFLQHNRAIATHITQSWNTNPYMNVAKFTRARRRCVRSYKRWKHSAEIE